MLKRSIKEAKSIKTKSSETKRLWRKCRKLQSGQDRQWIIMLINLLLLGLVLSSVGCGMKRLQRRDMRKVHIPDSIVYPRLKKIDKGAYTCEQKLYKCITHRDWDNFLYNFNRIKKTKQNVLNLIDEHNIQVERSRRILPDEIECKAFDLKCRSDKNSQLRQ